MKPNSSREVSKITLNKNVIKAIKSVLALLL